MVGHESRRGHFLFFLCFDRKLIEFVRIFYRRLMDNCDHWWSIGNEFFFARSFILNPTIQSSKSEIPTWLMSQRKIENESWINLRFNYRHHHPAKSVTDGWVVENMSE